MKKYYNKTLGENQKRLHPCYCGFTPHLVQETTQYNGNYPMIRYRVQCSTCCTYGYWFSRLPALIKQWNRKHL